MYSLKYNTQKTQLKNIFQKPKKKKKESSFINLKDYNHNLTRKLIFTNSIFT